MDFDVYTVMTVLIGIGLVEILLGVYSRSKMRTDDYINDLLGLGELAIVYKPAILFITSYGLGVLVPDMEGALSATPVWIAVVIIILEDEFLHYWYHRFGHEWPWLWKIHRTHHTTPEMNVIASFRENWLWYPLMPNLWVSASFVYFGWGEAYIYANVIIACFVLVTHADLKWDRSILARTFVRPLAHVFVFPMTHHLHHGIDEHSAPNGNYSTMLILWDFLFGTGQYPRVYPAEYGIYDDPLDPWYSQWLYPLIKSSHPSSDHHGRWFE